MGATGIMTDKIQNMFFRSANFAFKIGNGPHKKTPHVNGRWLGSLSKSFVPILPKLQVVGILGSCCLSNDKCGTKFIIPVLRKDQTNNRFQFVFLPRIQVGESIWLGLPAERASSPKNYGTVFVFQPIRCTTNQHRKTVKYHVHQLRITYCQNCVIV